MLFIAPRFFGYEEVIAEALRDKGANVDFILDRPFESAFMKAMARFFRWAIIGAADEYCRNKLNGFDQKEYGLVFVISGQTLSKKTLDAWRTKYSEAKFLLYMWDSFKNRRWAKDTLCFFDQSFTFDESDALENSINFRPLFFSPGFELNVEQKDLLYDISFIGTAHSDRFQVISEINDKLPRAIKSYWYLFLQAKWVFWVYKLINKGFRNAKLEDFKFRPMPKEDVYEVFLKSKVLLDMESPKQEGLTMRTIEALGSRKKLLTTNPSVKKYDFYSPSNICVINREAPVVPMSFFVEPYVEVPENIYKKYSLEGWLNELLSSVGY